MEVHPLFSPVIILYLPPFSYLLLSSSHITDTSAFDEVDIQHVRQNIQYVNMFVRQKFGNEQEAISMMVSCVILHLHVLCTHIQVEALKWRKEFAVNGLLLLKAVYHILSDTPSFIVRYKIGST